MRKGAFEPPKSSSFQAFPNSRIISQEEETAEALRVKGNAYYKSKDYAEALALYTQAIVG
jgi:tetratricopeptide (TPR) repeat protein